MKDNMDILLKKALEPTIEPDQELNNKVLESIRRKGKGQCVCQGLRLQ